MLPGLEQIDSMRDSESPLSVSCLVAKRIEIILSSGAMIKRVGYCRLTTDGQAGQL